MDKLKNLKLRFLIIESSQTDPIIEFVFPQKWQLTLYIALYQVHCSFIAKGFSAMDDDKGDKN